MHKVVGDHADKFHAGRPAGNYGPPVSLFNHALGRLDHRLRHLDDDPTVPHPALIRLVHELIVVAANSYEKEDRRVEATKPLLSQIFNTALHWNPSKTLYDIEPGAISEGHPPFMVIVEVKNEAGLCGDASLQAGLSYTHLVTAPKYKVRLFYYLPSSSVCTNVKCRPCENDRTALRSSVVSWAISSRSAWQCTLMGRTTICCFLSGCIWDSTLLRTSSVFLEHLQPLETPSQTFRRSTPNSMSTNPRKIVSHFCSPRLYRFSPPPVSYHPSFLRTG